MRALSFAAWIALVALPSMAGAQGVDDDARERARAAFARGVDAAEGGRWEEAVEAFEEAQGAVPNPTIRFNLAGALAQVGRLREAAAHYRAVLEAEGTDDLRATARRALRELDPRIPWIELVVRGRAPTDEVLLDDEPLDVEGVGLDVLVDPGLHRVAIRRDGQVLTTRRIRLREGETRSVELDLGGPSATGGDDEEGTPLRRSPVLWAAVGTAVAAGVLAAVLATRSDPSAYEGTFPPGMVTVR